MYTINELILAYLGLFLNKNNVCKLLKSIYMYLKNKRYKTNLALF